MEEWRNPKYAHLLKSGILLKSKESHINNIKLAEDYEIDNYITINYLKKSISQNYALINYLVNNNKTLIEKERLNIIFNYQPGQLLKKYGIDLKQLQEIYPYEERKVKNAIR